MIEFAGWDVGREQLRVAASEIAQITAQVLVPVSSRHERHSARASARRASRLFRAAAAARIDTNGARVHTVRT